MQIEIVHRANPQNTLSRKLGADAVHERAARAAEVIGHLVPGRDGVRLSEAGQIVPATLVFQVCVVDGEVGCEHGRRDFAAVGAVAYERLD